MNETHATYMNVSQSASKKTPNERSSVPFAYCLTLVILGILCFFRLLTTAALGFIIFQSHKTNQTQTLPLDNRTQQDKSTFQDTTLIEFPPDTGHEKDICKTRWSCCEDKCYYFSYDFKTFHESKNICKDMSATLVKIENEKELNFIRSQMYLFSWIGLSRKGTSSSWKWEDNSPPSLQMMSDWKESKDANCAAITKTRMTASDCSKSQPFTCEKRFPGGNT